MEYLAEIGIRATGYTTESTLLNTSIAANEVPARCVWAAHSIIWHFGGSYSIEVWAPLWSDWYNAGCPEDEEAAKTYLIPEKEEDRQLIKNIFGLMTNTLDQVSEVVRPDILNYMDENCYIIRPPGICQRHRGAERRSAQRAHGCGNPFAELLPGGSVFRGVTAEIA